MKRPILIVFLTFLTVPLLAQSADQYFHNGAQYFINADLQTSLNYVEEGLMEYPNDRKLNALYEKLKEEQEKQQQQQQQEQQQNQQNQEQEQQQEQQNQQQQDQQDQESEGEQKEQSEQSPQEVNPEDLQSQQISKEEAEKILRALAQKEKELLKEFKKKKSTGSAKHEKDW